MLHSFELQTCHLRHDACSFDSMKIEIEIEIEIRMSIAITIEIATSKAIPIETSIAMSIETLITIEIEKNQWKSEKGRNADVATTLNIRVSNEMI